MLGCLSSVGVRWECGGIEVTRAERIEEAEAGGLVDRRKLNR